MQPSDPRVESIYNSFSQICEIENKIFTKDIFIKKLHHELLTNPRIKSKDSITTALDYLLIHEKLNIETVSKFIFNSLKEEEQTSIPIKNFKFNNSKNCCIAPYSTLNFDTLGKIRVCCYNNYSILGEYPQTTLKSAWFSSQRQDFIKKINTLNFPKGCEKCKLQIITNNISNALFTKFDFYDNSIGDYPVNLEFDFSFTCNLECIMCGGKWSSSIRKNREKLPSLKSPYNEEFINQLRDFIPHTKTANFLGGEPFLTPIYYKIWDLFLELNPDASIYVTTNGTILNDKVKAYLSKSNMRVVLSLDSLKRDTYELIRKNSNFDTVMANLTYFLNTKKIASIAFCPLIQNVYELPDIAHFCIQKQIGFYINTVTKPLGGKIKGIHENESHNISVWTGDDSKMETISTSLETPIPEFCLSSLTIEELDKIIKHLQIYTFKLAGNTNIQKQYVDFVKSLNGYKYHKPENV
jgi:MoaA/NifB/PqqE/SkfB family radical SAM enzyme